MADTAPPAQHASSGAQQHPPPMMRRLSNALRAPFRRNSASSTQAEAPNSANVPDQAVSTSPPRAYEELPPIPSQENLASTKAPSSSTAHGVLPTSPTHQRHPSDVHAGKQRYTFTSDLNEPSPWDVLGTNDVDAREAAKSPPNAPVRRQSTLQGDPVFKAEGNLSRTRSPSHPGLTSFDTGDYVQDHVLEGVARLGHPFRKSEREPWEQSPKALAKERQLHQDNHLQQMIESEQAEGQEKANRLARQQTEREQHKLDKVHSAQSNQSPSGSQVAPHEQAATKPKQPAVSRSKTTDPNAFSHRQGSTQPLNVDTNTKERETSPVSPSGRRASAGSPTSPTSRGGTNRLGRKFSLGRTNSTSQAGPERHPGMIHMLDSGDFVQDKVLSAFAFAGGRRRSSAASSGPKSPVASPSAKPSQPTQQVPHVAPLPESMGERAEKARVA